MTADRPETLWRSRGYLPQFDQPGTLQAITFRLADSLPREVVERLDRLHAEDTTTKRREIDAYLDAGHGACWLQQPTNARLVESTLLHHDQIDYQLIAWVVMPNHVHVLIEPKAELAKIVQAWKSVTARRINTGDTAPRHIWQREYWDRWIRDERHYQQALAYIHANPVQAGLVFHGDEWRWSSAWAGRHA